MAGLLGVGAVVRALAVLSWREVRSLGSISGQNLFLFVMFVALQPASAAFFALLLLAVLLFPLASDPLLKIPAERRLSWPLLPGQWAIVRSLAVFLSPVAWLASGLLPWAGWRAALLLVVVSFFFFSLKYGAHYFTRGLTRSWSFRLPAPPGVVGAIAHLHWREMLHTLDPYLAFLLLFFTELYRAFGKALDPAAPRMLALVVALALSTEAQVLLGMDGRGAERYRLLPIRGWQILLAKDLAFLLLLALLVLPLDFSSGMCGGLAALAIGHHNSVFKIVPQARWRFTAGALFPHGALQTGALFAAGFDLRSAPFPLASLCLAAWIASVFFYGWQWDRLGRSHS